MLPLTACQVEKVQPEITNHFPNIDTRLTSYFERFVEEGASRGVEIDWALTPVHGTIGAIDETRVLGQCQFNSLYPNRITIDESFWKNASNTFREFVVFHELGHCVLLRDHKEDQNSEGICLSIMRSGKGTCRDAYNSFTRKYYLDELFSEDRRSSRYLLSETMQ